jgi:hypothetical protein
VNGGAEDPAQRRLHTQELEQARRRDDHRELHRVLVLTVREHAPEEGLERHRALDDPARSAQVCDVGTREPSSRLVPDRSIVAPDVIEVTRVRVRHGLHQHLLDGRVHDGEHAEADGESRQRDPDEQRSSNEPPNRQRDIVQGPEETLRIGVPSRHPHPPSSPHPLNRSRAPRPAVPTPDPPAQ